jgi:signal peptidase II
VSAARFRAGHGVAVALTVLALDQASKWAVLEALAPGQAVAVLPFFNLVLVWNQGVSFGLLSGVGAAAPWLVTALALAIAGLLIWWFRNETRGMARFAIALVLGGAFGNVLDRLRFGAVVDFLDFHLAGWHWPAFNLADTAVVCGAALLVLDSLGQRAHMVDAKGRDGR